jgi:ABC-type nitrate/sulfonate/bicarbonate transport system permease component
LSGLKQWTATAAIRLAPAAIFVVGWWTLSEIVGSDLLPPPGSVIELLGSSLFSDPIIKAQGGGSWGYLPHIEWTLRQFGIGFLVGGLIGTLVGLTASRLQNLSSCAGNLLEFFRAIPPLIMVPLVLVLLPPAPEIEPLIIGLYAALSLFAYTLEAVINVPVVLIDLARLLGARGHRLVFDVLMPAILPELLGAMRVTVVTSVGIAIVVEYLAMPSGIGRVMKFAASFSRIDLIIVGVIWAVIITLFVDVIMALLSRHFLRWQPTGVAK